MSQSTLVALNTLVAKSTLVAPLGRIIVKEIEVEQKTTGGILLSANAGDPNNTARKGEVVSSGIKTEYGDVEVGTIIYFGKHSGNKIQHESEWYVSLVQNDIVGVIVEWHSSYSQVRCVNPVQT